MLIRTAQMRTRTKLISIKETILQIYRHIDTTNKLLKKKKQNRQL